MMKNYYILFLLLFFIYSCKTQNLYINVLQPAPVTLPSYIKNAEVLNRSILTEQGKKIDVIDKVLSLEGANLDKEGLALRYIDILNYRKNSIRLLQIQEESKK